MLSISVRVSCSGDKHLRCLCADALQWQGQSTSAYVALTMQVYSKTIYQYISVVKDLGCLDEGYLAQPWRPFPLEVQHVGQYGLQSILPTDEICMTNQT